MQSRPHGPSRHVRALQESGRAGPELSASEAPRAVKLYGAAVGARPLPTPALTCAIVYRPTHASPRRASTCWTAGAALSKTGSIAPKGSLSAASPTHGPARDRVPCEWAAAAIAGWMRAREDLVRGVLRARCKLPVRRSDGCVFPMCRRLVGSDKDSGGWLGCDSDGLQPAIEIVVSWCHVTSCSQFDRSVRGREA